jgi:hypothetical protein
VRPCRTLRGWIGAAVLIGAAHGSGAACRSSCIEQALILLHETLDHPSDSCILSAVGAANQASYVFPPSTGSEDVACTVQSGPSPYRCYRSESTGAGVQTVATFQVFFLDFSDKRNGTDARAYFGGDTLDIQLTCGNVVIDRQQVRFMCPVPL